MSETKSRDVMPTWGSMYRFRYMIHQLGDIQLPRGISITALVVTVIAAIFVWRISSIFLPSQATLVVVVVAAIFTPRVVSVAEEGGRAPHREVAAWIRWAASPRYYRGLAPPQGPRDRQRLISLSSAAAAGHATTTAAVGAVFAELWTEFAPWWALRRKGEAGANRQRSADS